jgi:hypothetical protein
VKGVSGSAKFLNEDGVAFKGAVTLVGGQEKGVLVLEKADSMTK